MKHLQNQMNYNIGYQKCYDVILEKFLGNDIAEFYRTQVTIDCEKHRQRCQKNPVSSLLLSQNSSNTNHLSLRVCVCMSMHLFPTFISQHQKDEHTTDQQAAGNTEEEQPIPHSPARASAVDDGWSPMASPVNLRHQRAIDEENSAKRRQKLQRDLNEDIKEKSLSKQVRKHIGNVKEYTLKLKYFHS